MVEVVVAVEETTPVRPRLRKLKRSRRRLLPWTVSIIIHCRTRVLFVFISGEFVCTLFCNIAHLTRLVFLSLYSLKCTFPVFGGGDGGGDY